MPFTLVQKLFDTPLVFVDVETTGASCDWGDRVIEIGIVRVENGVRVGEFSQLFDPQRRIGAGASVLTGITQEMVAVQPTFSHKLPEIIQLMSGAAVLGHNVRFDLAFLHKEFRRCGVDLCPALSDTPVFDTVRIARRRFGRGGNGLQRLAPRLGIQPVTAHRALADAQTTHLVFEKLMEPVGGWNMCLADVMREQGGRMGLLPTNPRQSLLPLELEEALEMRLPVMMEYLDARQNRTNRAIVPQQVRRRNGEMILIAHCQLRNDQRTFKLDRIVRLERLGKQEIGLTASPLMIDQPVPEAPPQAAEVPKVPLAPEVS